LPFDGPSGPFNKTYSTKEQVKYNLINLLLTDPGERIMNPEFGCGLRRALFEGINENLTERIQNIIAINVYKFIPEIELTGVDVDSIKDDHRVYVTVNYKLVISQEEDQATVQFT
jgi:phage baseplate assembly protein W